MRSYHTEVWREAGGKAPERPCNPKPQLGQSHPSSISISKNEVLTKLVWNSNSNTHWKVFWKCLYKQKGTFPLICPSAWESNFLSEPTCLKWSQFPAQPALSKARWDMDNFLERRCFVILLLFLKQKKENSFSLFLFFQIKINYNPSLLMNAGWSWP